jgi:hypothetical protein
MKASFVLLALCLLPIAAQAADESMIQIGEDSTGAISAEATLPTGESVVATPGVIVDTADGKSHFVAADQHLREIFQDDGTYSQIGLLVGPEIGYPDAIGIRAALAFVTEDYNGENYHFILVEGGLGTNTRTLAISAYIGESYFGENRLLEVAFMPGASVVRTDADFENSGLGRTYIGPDMSLLMVTEKLPFFMRLTAGVYRAMSDAPGGRKFLMHAGFGVFLPFIFVGSG